MPSDAALSPRRLRTFGTAMLWVFSGFPANSPDGRGGPRPRGMRPPDAQEQGFGPGMPPPQRPGPGGPDGRAGRGGMAPHEARPADTSRFMRGVQLTDQQGIAEFTTLYPGWYAGRAIHVHLKVHLGGSTDGGNYTGGHVSHTGQLFFPEDVTDQVAKLEPYAKRLSIHRTLQGEDGIFNAQHGSTSIVNLTGVSVTNVDWFIATATLAVDPEAMPSTVGGPGGQRGPRPFDH